MWFAQAIAQRLCAMSTIAKRDWAGGDYSADENLRPRFLHNARTWRHRQAADWVCKVMGWLVERLKKKIPQTHKDPS